MISIALSAIAAACSDGATSPGSTTPTGYLMTVTPGASCSAALGSPLRVVIKYEGEFSAEHVFRGLRTIGTPRDPTLTVRLRNTGVGVIEGSVYAGFSSFGGAPGLFFGMPDSPSFPVAVPFSGAGDVLKSDITATVNAEIWNPRGSCTASDHKLRFERVFDKLE